MLSAEDILEKILLIMVLGLVDDENSAHIHTTTSSEGTILFEVDADKGDVGKLIGRSGKTAGAIRHIMGAASAKLGVRTIISIPDKRFV